MTNNPNTKARKESKRAATNSQFVLGKVEEISQDTHMVGVNVQGEDADLEASALSSRIGDVSLPDIGEHVLVGYTQGGWPISFGSVYFDDDGVPSFNPSDRRVGNSTSGSNMTVSRDGEMAMNANAEPVNNEGIQEEHEHDGDNLHITPDGEVSISNGRGGPNVHIGTDGNIEITTDSGDAAVTIEGSNITVEGESVEVKSTSASVEADDVAIDATNVDVNSTNIRLGGTDVDAVGVAREGDSVPLIYNGVSRIEDGSSDVRST